MLWSSSPLHCMLPSLVVHPHQSHHICNAQSKQLMLTRIFVTVQAQEGRRFAFSEQHKGWRPQWQRGGGGGAQAACTSIQPIFRG